MFGFDEDNARRAQIAARTTLAIVVAAGLAVLPGTADARDDRSWFLNATKSNSDSSNGSSFWGQTFDGAFASSGSETTNKRLPTLSKQNIEPMKVAIKRYKAIVKRGGWKTIPPQVVKLKLQRGMKHPAVKLLRQRLVATGDMKASSADSAATDGS